MGTQPIQVLLYPSIQTLGDSTVTARLIRPKQRSFGTLPARLQHRMTFIVTHLCSLIDAGMRQGELREFHLSLRERLTLELLSAYPDGLPQYVIAGHLNLSQSVVVILVNRMVKRSLVERRENPTNRRESLVTLTDYGVNFTTRLMTAVDKRTAELTAAISKDDVAEVMRIARGIIEYMETEMLGPTVVKTLLFVALFPGRFW